MDKQKDIGHSPNPKLAKQEELKSHFLSGFHGFIMNREPRALLVNILFLHGLFPCAVNNVFPGGWYIGTAFLLYIAFPPLYTVFQKLRNVNRPAVSFKDTAYTPATHSNAYGAALSSSRSNSSSHFMTIKNTTHMIT